MSRRANVEMSDNFHTFVPIIASNADKGLFQEKIHIYFSRPSNVVAQGHGHRSALHEVLCPLVMAYNVISLFSGAMGLDLGIERAGFKIRICIEKDKEAANTIRANTNIPVIEDDICNITTEKILSEAGLERKDVKMVIGGPPCQAFSTAGKQKGLSDFRGNLILQYLRIIRDIRPEYFIMENVRGILSAKLNYIPDEYIEYNDTVDKKGSVLNFLVSEFKKLGYSISYALLNSANYGVPEKRERVIFIGHIGSRVPIPNPTHSENGVFGTKKWQTLHDAIGDLEKKTGLQYLPLRSKSIPYLSILKEGQNWKDLSPEHAKEAMGKAYFLGGGKTGFLRRLNFSEPSPTLVTSPTMPATLLCHPTQLRPLAIEEYRRIQQFPDNWKFIGNITSIYRQIGNAVPIGLAQAIGTQIMRHINGETSVDEEIKNKIPYSRYSNSVDSEMSRLFEPTPKYKK